MTEVWVKGLVCHALIKIEKKNPDSDENNIRYTDICKSMQNAFLGKDFQDSLNNATDAFVHARDFNILKHSSYRRAV